MARQADAIAEFGHVERMTESNGRSNGSRVALTPPRDREIAFAAASRRSARVRFLRKAILFGVVGAIGSMAAIWIFNPFAARFGNLSFSALSVEGSKVEISRPKLSGFRSDGQPYSLTAERALQDIKQPTRVELENLTGEIGMAGGQATHISADSGIYDSVSEHMRLNHNIKIGNGQFDIRLRSADIDFKTGVYKSAEPVEVQVGA